MRGSSEEAELKEKQVYFVDLPGYGHAEVPKALRRHWDKLLSSYLLEREAIAVLALMSDCRRALSNDEEWFLGLDIPAHKLLVLTKADKLSANKRRGLRQSAASYLDVSADSVFLTSAGAKQKLGVSELAAKIGAILSP